MEEYKIKDSFTIGFLEYQNRLNVDMILYNDSSIMIDIEDDLTKEVYRFRKNIKEIKEIIKDSVKMEPEQFYKLSLSILRDEQKDSEKKIEIATDKANIILTYYVDLLQEGKMCFQYNLEFEQLERKDISRMIKMMKDFMDERDYLYKKIEKLEDEMGILKTMTNIKTNKIM